MSGTSGAARTLAVCAVLLGGVLLASVRGASAQTPTPVGTELSVHSSSPNGYGAPDVGMAADGDAVVTWPNFSFSLPPFPEE